MFGLKSLEGLYLQKNNLSGTFTVAGASTNLTGLDLFGNKLTGFVGGGILSNLQILSLSENEFEGEIVITEETFPTSIIDLKLNGNKLTGFVGGRILTNLQGLYLSDNEFEGEIVITAKTFPTSIIVLYLNGNKLTGFVGGGILTNLQGLYLSDNEFEGEIVITEETFPTSISYLYLNGNTGLTSVDADPNAVPKLGRLSLSFIDGIVVKSELCNRRRPAGLLQISPNTACASA